MHSRPHVPASLHRKDKWFGLSLMVMMMCLAGVAWLRWQSPTIASLAAAAGILQAGLYYGVPASRPFVSKLFFSLTWPLAVLVSLVLLAALYYLVLSPIGIALRLLGQDPLSKNFLEADGSFWVKSTDAQETESYFRQY